MLQWLGAEYKRAKILIGATSCTSKKNPPFLTLSINLRARKFRRAEAFEKDYPAFLLALASSLRTGLDPLLAIKEVSLLFSEKSLLRKELEAFTNNLAKGERETTALNNFAGSINHPDVSLFNTAFSLARANGSPLAGCLERLAKVTRRRQSFRRKIKAAIALQRVSAIGIAGCALIIFSLQICSNWRAVLAAWQHPLASKVLMGGSALILGGLIWMANLSKMRI